MYIYAVIFTLCIYKIPESMYTVIEVLTLYTY